MRLCRLNFDSDDPVACLSQLKKEEAPFLCCMHGSVFECDAAAACSQHPTHLYSTLPAKPRNCLFAIEHVLW